MQKKKGNVYSFSVSTKDDPIIQGLAELAEKEKVPFSRLLVAAAKDYLAKYIEGLPQTTLEGARVVPYNPVMEQAKESSRELEDLIKANPGKTLNWIRGQAKRQLGMRWETTEEHLRSLQALNLVRIKSLRFYHREYLEGGVAMPGWAWKYFGDLAEALRLQSLLLDQAYNHLSELTGPYVI